MDTDAAAALARQLMDAHGLQGWRFQFDRAVRRFGGCYQLEQVISLSRPLTELNTVDTVREAILHEIAHGLTPKHHGHGREWAAMARKIGCSSRRCYGDHVVVPPRKVTWFVGTCPGCLRQIYRRQRRNIACGHCSPLAYKKKFAFRWRRPTAKEQGRLDAWQDRHAS
jgi:predicted SprT family Zn-dependent metalloprotease